MSVINPQGSDAATQARLPNGTAAAAVLAAGIGCFALGLFTTLAQAIHAVGSLLNWWNPVGPLSGKTGLAYVVWLISWVVVHRMMKDQDVNFGKAYAAGLILIALGLLGTFPLFFGLFH